MFTREGHHYHLSANSVGKGQKAHLSRQSGQCWTHKTRRVHGSKSRHHVPLECVRAIRVVPSWKRYTVIHSLTSSCIRKSGKTNHQINRRKANTLEFKAISRIVNSSCLSVEPKPNHATKQFTAPHCHYTMPATAHGSSVQSTKTSHKNTKP